MYSQALLTKKYMSAVLAIALVVVPPVIAHDIGIWQRLLLVGSTAPDVILMELHDC
jgi:hypothetical protein